MLERTSLVSLNRSAVRNEVDGSIGGIWRISISIFCAAARYDDNVGK